MEEEALSSFSSLELELWFVDNRFAIWDANCLRRSSLYLAMRRSDMEFEPEPKDISKISQVRNLAILKNVDYQFDSLFSID